MQSVQVHRLYKLTSSPAFFFSY